MAPGAPGWSQHPACTTPASHILVVTHAHLHFRPPHPTPPHPPPLHFPQVLCVFNNSTTSRSPLALALSVDSCRSWEPLAIVEEDAAGESERASEPLGCRVWGLEGAVGWQGAVSEKDWRKSGGANVPPPTQQQQQTCPQFTAPPPSCFLLGANFSCPSVVEWSDDTIKVAYTVWGQGLRLATVKLATVEAAAA